MDSKRNVSVSAISFIENVLSVEGYSLKRYSLKKWIYENGHTQPFIARKMNLEPEEFKRKLREREKFDEQSIRALVHLMHAEEAFKVLYFPTKCQRREVWWQIFGKYKEKRNE